MPSNELPADGDWETVEQAIRRQRGRLGMSLGSLSRESGISETTIRYIGRPEKRQRSTLVALSAALGYHHNHLARILRGEAGEDEDAPPPFQTADFETETRQRLDDIEKKVDVLIINQLKPKRARKANLL